MDLINIYLREKTVSEASKKTYKKYLSSLNISGPDSIPDKPSMTQIALEQRERLSPKAFNTWFSTCKGFFNWAVDEDHIVKSPLKESLRLKKAENKTKKLTLTSEELLKLKRYAEDDLNPPKSLMVRLMLSLGLRGIELTRFKVEDITTLNGVSGVYIQGKGKSEKDKIFRKISDDLYDDLLLYCTKNGRKSEDFVFITTKGNQYNSGDLSRFFKQLFRDCLRRSEDGLTMHSIRHSVAVYLLEQGQSIEQVADLLRHSNSETTKIYSHKLEQKTRLNNEVSEDKMIQLLG